MIIWLEDRRSTVLTYERALKDRGIHFVILSSIDEVDQLLNDGVELDNLTFVIDIMLHGVDDLNSIGIPNAPTVSGNRAGQVFVERYLRAQQSQYAKCPVIFLTERLIDARLEHEVKTLEREDAGPVHIFPKYSNRELEQFLSTLEKYMSAGKAA